MAAITEAGFLGGADYTSHDSFGASRTDEGTTVVEADYDTDWGAGNANDWATAMKAMHKWARGDSPVTGDVQFDGSPVVGDGAGSGNLQLVAAAASNFALDFHGNGSTTVAANDKRYVHNATETLTAEHYNGSSWDTVWTIDNTPSFEVAVASRFNDDVTLDSASPVFTMGDASGGPIQRLDKDDASAADVVWRSESNDLWAWRADTSENFTGRRYNTSGVYQDDWISVNNSTGNITVANQFTGVDASGSTVRGSIVADSDLGGLVSTISFTNDTDSPQDTAAAAIGNWRAAGVSGTFAGWVKIYVGTTAAWFPYWT